MGTVFLGGGGVCVYILCWFFLEVLEGRRFVGVVCDIGV